MASLPKNRSNNTIYFQSNSNSNQHKDDNTQNQSHYSTHGQQAIPNHQINQNNSKNYTQNGLPMFKEYFYFNSYNVVQELQCNICRLELPVGKQLLK